MPSYSELVKTAREMSKEAFGRTDVSNFLLPGFALAKGFFNREPNYKQREKELRKARPVAGDYGFSREALQGMRNNVNKKPF